MLSSSSATRRRQRPLAGFLIATLAIGTSALAANKDPYIVQGSSAPAASRDVRAVGATVNRRLDVIHAVSAQLTPQQVTRLSSIPGIRIYGDRAVNGNAAAKGAPGKASLAGVQEKVLLARVGARWAQCLYGYASTHILKPVSRPHSDMIYNEEYASRLARALGLAPYATWIESFEGTDALVIERYDRDDAVPGGRLHQEDFNQVLGASGAQKYQEHGGKVSLARIASVLSATQGREGVEQLLTLVTLAVAVGNLDMHAKNISLLHPPDGSARLAPAYDMVPLTHYPGIDGRMAMSINDLYEHSRIGLGDLVTEAARWGVGHARAEVVVAQALATIRATVQAETPHIRATPGLADQIRTLTNELGASA